MQNIFHDNEFNSLYQDLNSFSIDRYSHILHSLKQKWNFSCPDKNISPKSIFLRHDVDYSLEKTLIMSRIEDSLGIHSHYYFLTESSSYNINSRRFTDVITEISTYNMCIGLHFDWINRNLPAIYDFEVQVRALQAKTKSEIIHFSPHNPGSLDVADSYDFPRKYLNAYSYLKKYKMGYLSDSNGSWNDQYLEEFLQKIDLKPFQILIHPEWWGFKTTDQITKIIEAYTEEYLDNLNSYYELHTRSGVFDKHTLNLLTNRIELISKAIAKITK